MLFLEFLFVFGWWRIWWIINKPSVSCSVTMSSVSVFHIQQTFILKFPCADNKRTGRQLLAVSDHQSQRSLITSHQSVTSAAAADLADVWLLAKFKPQRPWKICWTLQWVLSWFWAPECICWIKSHHSHCPKCVSVLTVYVTFFNLSFPLRLRNTSETRLDPLFWKLH